MKPRDGIARLLIALFCIGLLVAPLPAFAADSPTPTTLMAENVIAAYGGPAHLHANLSLASGPVVGAALVFAIDGTSIGTAVTDAAGDASADWVVRVVPGNYTVTVTYAGSADYTPAMVTSTLTVTKATATLTYNGDLVATGGPFRLSAYLAGTGAIDPGTVNVQFQLRQLGAVVATYTAPVDPLGNAVVPATPNVPLGAYTLDVSLLPNSDYDAAPITALIRGSTTLTLVQGPLPVEYGRQVAVVSQLVCGNTPLAGKVVSLTDGYRIMSMAITDATGTATFIFEATLPAGTYPITVSFPGDSDFAASATTGTLSVYQYHATLTYTGDTVATGGPIHLSAALTTYTYERPVFPSGALTVRFNLQQNGVMVYSFTAPVDYAGNAAVVPAPSIAGAFTVLVMLDQNSYFTAQPVIADIRPAPSALTLASPVTVAAGDNAWIGATLTNGTAPLPGQNVTFTVNGAALPAVTTDTGGRAGFGYPAQLVPGTYPVIATYAGDAAHAPATAAGQLVVTKGTAGITYNGEIYSQGTAMELRALLAAPGQWYPDGLKMLFQLSQHGTVTATYQAPVSASGVASYQVLLPQQSFDLTVSLLPNAYYTAADVTQRLWAGINPVPDNPTYKVTYGDTITLGATLKDGAQPLAGETLTFKADNTVLGTAVTDASGTAHLDYQAKLAAGQHYLYVTWDGNADWSGGTGMANLQVMTISGTLTYTGDMVPNGSPFHLSARYVPDHGTFTDGQLTMQFDVQQNGTILSTYTVPVDASGNATVTNPPALPVGSYGIEVSLLPNGIFSPTSLFWCVRTPTPAPTAITIPSAGAVFSGQATIRATLTANYVPIANQPLTLTIGDGMPVTVQTDSAGVATLTMTVNLPAGTYPVTASYGGDGSLYSASTASTNLTVIAAPGTLTYTGDRAVSGGPFAVSAHLGATMDTVPEGALTALFQYFQNGDLKYSFTAPADAAGNFTVSPTPTLAIGAYAVTVTLQPNPYFKALDDSASVRARTLIAVTNATAAYGDTVTLTGRVTSGGLPLAGKAIDISVKGQSVGTAVTDANGVVSLPYQVGVAPGNQNVLFNWAGDLTYAPEFNACQLTVTKGTPVVSVANVTGVRNTTATLRATVTAYGQPMKGVVVTFSVAGTVAGTAVTDATGVAVLQYPLTRTAGTYTLSAGVSGDGTLWNGASGAGLLTITRK